MGRMTALRKDTGRVRGIVAGSVIRRVVCRAVARQFDDHFLAATAPADHFAAATAPAAVEQFPAAAPAAFYTNPYIAPGNTEKVSELRKFIPSCCLHRPLPRPCSGLHQPLHRPRRSLHRPQPRPLCCLLHRCWRSSWRRSCPHPWSCPALATTLLKDSLLNCTLFVGRTK